MTQKQSKQEAVIEKSESQIAVQSQAAVPAVREAHQDTLQDLGLDASDILIPKLLLMQGQSVLVVEGKAAQGEFRNSVTGEKLASKDDKLEFIPLRAFKTWQISHKATEGKDKGKYKFAKNIPFTPQNANLPYEGLDEEGNDAKNVLTLNYYILLASDVANGEAFPYVVSFRSTSKNAGKNLATHFAKSLMLRQKPHHKALNLSCHLDRNDDGAYYVFDITPSRKATPEEMEAADTWLPIVSAGNARVDTSDEASGGASASSDASTNNSREF